MNRGRSMKENVEINRTIDTERISSNNNVNTSATGIKQNGVGFEQDNRLQIQLRKQLLQAGCFKPALIQHSLHMLAVVVLYAAGYTVLLHRPTIGMYFIALVMLAFANVQAGSIAHEAGHGAIVKRRWVAELVGQFFDSFLTALSYSHYQYIHKLHHSHCNEQAEDLDMQSDLFSLYPESVLAKRTRIARFITRYQAYLIWPLISLQGFTLKLDGLNTVRNNPQTTRIDQVALVLHLALWFGLPVHILGLPNALLNYVLMTWFIGPYLGYILLANHIGTRTIGPNEIIPAFTQRLVTTRNLGHSRIHDLVFRGLNNHIEHHLFPSISSFRLPHARVITRAFCKTHNLPYREMTWFKAAGELFAYLNQVAEHDRIACVNENNYAL